MRRLHSTAVTITDPLVKYHSLVASGICCPCPAQHRLARHLSKIYLRVKDYSPRLDYPHSLHQVSALLAEDSLHHRARRNGTHHEHEDDKGSDDGNALALPHHAIWRNPLFRHLLLPGRGSGRGTRLAGFGPSLLLQHVGTGTGTRERRKGDRGSLALTRVLTDHQAAAEMDSPRGLFLSGEVGTGKSMLLRLLADGLPTSKKAHWHFNTFMLHTLAQLESHRAASSTPTPTITGTSMHGTSRSGINSSSSSSGINTTTTTPEYSLLWMARNLVADSPVLFLDEFQFPDRAASKILTHLFVAFFQLGGVLVASSNRMPEELDKAAGVSFHAGGTTPRGFVGRMLRSGLGGLGSIGGGGGGGSGSGGLRARPASDFADFLDVLKARCDFWHIEGTRDWRRREDGDDDVTAATPPATTTTTTTTTTTGDTFDSSPNVTRHPQRGTDTGIDADTPPSHSKRPHHYHLLDTHHDSPPHVSARPSDQDDQPNPSADADDQFHQHILHAVSAAASSTSPGDNIPWQPSHVLVYGRTVPVPRHHAGLALFHFPELVGPLGPADYITLASSFHTFIIDRVPVLTLARKNEARRFITLLDALYEARCKLVVRAEAGPDDLFFPDARPSPAPRPPSPSAPPFVDDATYAETIAEVYQDSTAPFRPNISEYNSPTTPPPPLSPAYNPDQDSDFGHPPTSAHPNFTDSRAFIGEDERFAYRRAASRLWELCSARWHARHETDWWRPLPLAARPWERGPPSTPRNLDRDPVAAAAAASAAARRKTSEGEGGERVGASVPMDEVAGLSRWRIDELRKSGGGSTKS